MYVEKKRRCDTGCRRTATVLRVALDLAFCDKHIDLYIDSGPAEHARMIAAWGAAYMVTAPEPGPAVVPPTFA